MAPMGKSRPLRARASTHTPHTHTHTPIHKHTHLHTHTYTHTHTIMDAHARRSTCCYDGIVTQREIRSQAGNICFLSLIGGKFTCIILPKSMNLVIKSWHHFADFVTTN